MLRRMSTTAGFVLMVCSTDGPRLPCVSWTHELWAGPSRGALVDLPKTHVCIYTERLVAGVRSEGGNLNDHTAALPSAWLNGNTHQAVLWRLLEPHQDPVECAQGQICLISLTDRIVRVLLFHLVIREFTILECQAGGFFVHRNTVGSVPVQGKRGTELESLGERFQVSCEGRGCVECRFLSAFYAVFDLRNCWFIFTLAVFESQYSQLSKRPIQYCLLSNLGG